MELVIAIVLLAAVAAFVTAPLRGGGGEGEDPVRADLEARREAKYREIRDAEMDREQGKLSPADWARIDSELRREAIDVLRELDKHGGGAAGGSAEPARDG